MSSIVRDGISYDGISDYIPVSMSSFSQRSIDKIITLDTQMPNIEDILKVKVYATLEGSKVVRTAKGESFEGQVLSGYKLLSEGEFVVRIDYCGQNNNGCIYTFKDSMYFSNATAVSEDRGTNSKIVENIYIEDIYVEKISERDLIANISFIVAIEECW